MQFEWAVNAVVEQAWKLLQYLGEMYDLVRADIPEHALLTNCHV